MENFTSEILGSLPAVIEGEKAEKKKMLESSEILCFSISKIYVLPPCPNE